MYYHINIKWIINCTCYYFDNIIKIEDCDLDNILKSYENILNLFAAKSLRIRFDKIDGFIRLFDGTRYLILFGREKYDFVYNRIRCLIGV